MKEEKRWAKVESKRANLIKHAQFIEHSIHNNENTSGANSNAHQA